MSDVEWPRDNAELVAQLARQRDRYEQLVRNMSDLLLLMDPDGTVSFCNRQQSLPPGAAAYPAAGEPAAECVDEADRAAFNAAVEDVRSRGVATREVLFHVSDGAGGRRAIEGALTPVLEAGKVVQIQFLGRDVTERRRAAEALQQANETLRKQQAELQSDLDVAAKIHLSLLPAPLATDRVLIDLKHLPLLGVGGDYVYIHRSDPARPAVAVFDVSGHGIAPALVANRMHSAVYAIMNQGSPPVQMIDRLNRFLHDSFAELGIFATLFALQLDLDAGAACYCGSGHPPALLKRAASGQVVQLQSQHMPLGVAANVFVGEPATRVRIDGGDTVWIYTDGLVELGGPEAEPLGIEGLIRRLDAVDTSAPETGLAERCLQGFMRDLPAPADDVTLCVVAVR